MLLRRGWEGGTASTDSPGVNLKHHIRLIKAWPNRKLYTLILWCQLVTHIIYISLKELVFKH